MFGSPKFAAAPIITMCIVMMVTFTESTADMLAVGEMVDKEVTPDDLARGLAIVVFVLNLVFNHWGAQDDGESAVQLAVDEGAVVHSSFGDSGGS
ncbi:MAG TPA: solute carrier family 23 protein [Solirubrobacteraceae bacterium]